MVSNSKPDRSKFRQIIKAFLIAVALVLFISCSILFLLVSRFDAPSFAQGSQRASEVIVALERHRQGWGKHPSELQQLVPDFLSEIPQPGWRYAYQYRVCDNGIGYLLYFQTGNEGYCGFMSKSAEWKCEFSDSTLPFWRETPCSQSNSR